MDNSITHSLDASIEARPVIGVPAGCYVHVPFCLQKCRYCAFYSETHAYDHAMWARAVISEARMLCSTFGSFDSLYFGGGTPSVLSDELLEELLVGIRGELKFCGDVETTIELNPGDVDLARARRLRAMGFNRASLGVQSFDDHVLSFLGRRHDRKRAISAYEALRGAGFDNVGVDLIWGVPHAGLRSVDSARFALELLPEHLSCYSLTVESGTLLHSDVEAGRVGKVSDDALSEEALELWGVIGERGYEHYEVSNFARTREYRSRHNSKYWAHVPYLGLGPSAHSFDGLCCRWGNVRSVSGYVEALFAGSRAVEFEERLSEGQLLLERVMLGIRTSEGVCRELVSGSGLSGLVSAGLVVEGGSTVVPTERGMLVADALAGALAGGLEE